MQLDLGDFTSGFDSRLTDLNSVTINTGLLTQGMSIQVQNPTFRAVHQQTDALQTANVANSAITTGQLLSSLISDGCTFSASAFTLGDVVDGVIFTVSRAAP